MESLGHCQEEQGSRRGVYISGTQVAKGDYSGPEGARLVFSDTSVENAVLEVARGGILRRGLPFKECDIGIMLNISSDHLGEGGIEDLEDLTRLKSTVIESVKPTGWAILNGDDPLVMSRVDNTKGRILLFSTDPSNPLLFRNLQKGGKNVTLTDGKIVLHKPGLDSVIIGIKDIPLTFDGKAKFNVYNVLAAVGAGVCSGLTDEEIRKGLMTFHPDTQTMPGRMNLIDLRDFEVLVDYGHNIGASESLREFLKEHNMGRILRVASGSGNRRDEDLINFGLSLSDTYDKIILCDPDPRDRPVGETPELILKGLKKGGMAGDKIKIREDEIEAVIDCLNMASTGDLLVIQADEIGKVIETVEKYKSEIG